MGRVEILSRVERASDIDKFLGHTGRHYQVGAQSGPVECVIHTDLMTASPNSGRQSVEDCVVALCVKRKISRAI